MKKETKDMFVIGFALFSMFFGAGNVIFPPFLGMEAGGQWWIGFLCYYLADIGLALLAIFAMLKVGSGAEGITGRLGNLASKLLMSAIVLCIGPLLAIPRTAASTFEMSIQPLVSGLSLLVFSVLFFAVILALCIRESAVVDIVGKILTPALFVGLLVLIAVGVFQPLGPIAPLPKIDSVPAAGIQAGYQTMDVLAAMLFGILILQSARDKGYTDKKASTAVVRGGSIIAGIGLLVVYAGLTYLGATASALYGESMSRSALVVAIVEGILGKAGLLIFAVVVALACVTTAVALVSSAASYFAKLSGGKLGYKALVIGICVFSTVVSNFGLEQIVSIATPILNIVYPPALVLIALSFFSHRLRNDNIFRMAALGALLTSLLETAASYGVSLPFLARLPLSTLGFAWVLPAALFGIIGVFLGRDRGGLSGRKQEA